jgi:hypothetical protein
MTTVEEITALEENLRHAELGPDPQFFKDVLADNVVLNNRPGWDRVMDAHRAGDTPKFTRVEMSDLDIRQHGDTAAVVTCKGKFEGPNWSGTLQFMRVWLKTDGAWKIIAGSVSTIESAS